jgi:MFS family permease
MAQAPGATLEPAGTEDGFRPTAILPLRQLFDISIYWLGLTCIAAGVGQILAGRLQYESLVPKGTEGAALVQMTVAGAFIAAVVQPTVGSISDYTTSRWGRRKPYIFIGSILDVIFLAGIATSNTVVTIAAFVLLLQVSSNFAQGPFQGYVPDLVPEPQVGIASALLGIFSVLGNVTGTIVSALGVAFHQYAIATVGLGIIEVTTMLVVVVRVNEGKVAKDRAGKSWIRVAASAWGTDILRERSFMWLLGSRFFFLTAGGVVFSLALFYLARSLSMGEREAGTMLIVVSGVIAVSTVSAIVPSARLSDRFGRKPVIWGACAIGIAGYAVLIVAPAFPIACLGAALYGIANGTFLAVDWALMTDIIPKASSGRYMGLSNVATASSGIVALAVGGLIMDIVGGPEQAGSGPRASLVFAIFAFIVASILLIPVREPLRGRAAERARAAAAPEKPPKA